LNHVLGVGSLARSSALPPPPEEGAGGGGGAATQPPPPPQPNVPPDTELKTNPPASISNTVAITIVFFIGFSFLRICIDSTPSENTRSIVQSVEVFSLRSQTNFYIINTAQTLAGSCLLKYES